MTSVCTMNDMSRSYGPKSAVRRTPVGLRVYGRRAEGSAATRDGYWLEQSRATSAAKASADLC